MDEDKRGEGEHEHISFFNPTLSQFLKKNKEMSLLGFSWALYWRIQLLLFAIAIVIMAVLAAFGVDIPA